MSRSKPVARAIKLLSLIERNANGLRVTDMAEQLGAPPRAVYRDLDVLQQLEVPLYTDKNGKESFWKIDPDYRNRLSVPFTLAELLSASAIRVKRYRLAISLLRGSGCVTGKKRAEQ